MQCTEILKATFIASIQRNSIYSFHGGKLSKWTISKILEAKLDFVPAHYFLGRTYCVCASDTEHAYVKHEEHQEKHEERNEQCFTILNDRDLHNSSDTISFEQKNISAIGIESDSKLQCTHVDNECRKVSHEKLCCELIDVPNMEDPFLYFHNILKLPRSEYFTIFLKDMKLRMLESMHHTKIEVENANAIENTYLDNFFRQLQSQTPKWTRREKYVFLRNIMLKSKNALYALQHEVEFLAFLLHTSQQDIWKFLSRARYEQRTGISIRLNATAKAVVMEWIKQNPHKHPTPEERNQLIQKSGLGTHQFFTVYSVLKEKRYNISDNAKNYLKEWLEINKRKPTPLERKQLRIEIGLSRTQVNTQIRLLSSQHGPITPHNKKLIEEWLIKNNNRSPTIEERIQLEKLTGLSRAQVSKQILYIQDAKGKVTEVKKDFIRKWLIEHPCTNLTREDRYYLQQETKLSQQQITNLIRSLRRPPGEITNEIKNKLKLWLRENNFRYPTESERETLLNNTQLSYDQLRSQLRRLKYGQGKTITRSVRQRIQERLEFMNEKPPKEVIAKLAEEFGLTKDQIYFQVRSYFERKTKITPKIKDLVLQWVSSLDSRTPTKEERDQLQRETGLGRMQLNFQIHIAKKKLKGVTQN